MTGGKVIKFTSNCASYWLRNLDENSFSYILTKNADEFPGGAKGAQDIGLIPDRIYMFANKEFEFEDKESGD